MNYPAYPTYKESGVAWLGKVPEHWEVWKVSHGFTSVGSGTTPPADNDLWYGGNIPWVTTSELRENFIATTSKKVSQEAVSVFSALKVFPKGSLAIAMYGATIGRLGILDSPATTNQACCVLSGEKALSIKFMFFWFQAYRSQIILLGSGGGQPNISQDKIRSIRVACPDIIEQTTIADFLDRETGCIDTLVEKKKRLIALLKEKRGALISRTVTRGLPAEAAREFGLEPHARFKDSGIEWLGDVPEGWEALPLRRSTKFVKTGNTPNGAETYHFEDGGFNWYSPSDFSDAVYLGTANRALSAEGQAEVRIFPEMTVMLVGIGATIGKVGLAANECSCNQQINAIICNSKLDPVFATYYLKTMRDFIIKCGKFTTLPIINQDETKNLILAIPPIPEQTAIATYLDRETAKIDKLIGKVEEAIERLQEYRAALITAAVTGKIDVRYVAQSDGQYKHAAEEGEVYG